MRTCIAVHVLPSWEPDATALSQSPSGCSGTQRDSRLLKERDPFNGRTHPGVRTSTYHFSAAAFVSLGPLLKHTRWLSVTVSKLHCLDVLPPRSSLQGPKCISKQISSGCHIGPPIPREKNSHYWMFQQYPSSSYWFSSLPVAASVPNSE